MISTTSAFLPGVSEPMRSSRRSALAPPIVAQCATSSARNRLCTTVSPRACASRCSRERSADSVARMAENRSALHHTLVSIDSETGMPCLRSSQVGG